MTTINELSSLSSYASSDLFLVEHSSVAYKCTLSKLTEILLSSPAVEKPAIGTISNPVGNIYSTGNLTVTGTSTFSNSVTFAGGIEVHGSLITEEAVTVSALHVTGETNPVSTFENNVVIAKMNDDVIDWSTDLKNLVVTGTSEVGSTATFRKNVLVGTSTSSESTSTTTGSLVVSGGAGISGSVYIGGVLHTNNIAIPVLGTFGTSGASASNKSCQVYGKLGVSGNVEIGGGAVISGSLQATSGTFDTLNVAESISFVGLSVTGNTTLGTSGTNTYFNNYSNTIFYKSPEFRAGAVIGLAASNADLTVNGNVTAKKYNNLTLSSNTTGFSVTGGTTPKTLTVAGTTNITADVSVSEALTASKALTVSAVTTIAAATSITGALTVSSPLTIGAGSTYTGAVTVRSTGSSATVIQGPNNGTITLPTDISGNSLQKALVQTTSAGGDLSASWLAYTNAGTASTLVYRDGSGNFSAGTITADLTGTASKATGDASGNTITSTYLNKTTSTAQTVAAATTFNSTLTVANTAYLGGASSGYHTRVLVSSSKNYIQGYNGNTATDLYLDPSGGTVYLCTTSTSSGAYVNTNGIYNAVWADLVDTIVVDDEAVIEPGYCYCFDGKKYHKSTKYMDSGIVGLESDTYGFIMGERNVENEMHVAVAGFVLAYVDKIYKPGTPLTCTKDGKLTKIGLLGRILHSEKIVGTFWRTEPNDTWGTEVRRVKVNGRCWIKIQ